MTSMTRWDPYREMTSLRDAMNQLMEQAIVRPGLAPFGTEVAGQGQMNVLELNGQYICQVWLPGANPTDVDLTVRQNTLTLQAKLGEPFSAEQRKQGTYLLREFGAGEVTRSITFPKDVDGDAIEAHYDRGVLSITVPVAQHAQPRRVKISEAKEAQSFPFVESHAEKKQPVEALSGNNGTH